MHLNCKQKKKLSSFKHMYIFAGIIRLPEFSVSRIVAFFHIIIENCFCLLFEFIEISFKVSVTNRFAGHVESTMSHTKNFARLFDYFVDILKWNIQRQWCSSCNLQKTIFLSFKNIWLIKSTYRLAEKCSQKYRMDKTHFELLFSTFQCFLVGRFIKVSFYIMLHFAIFKWIPFIIVTNFIWSFRVDQSICNEMLSIVWITLKWRQTQPLVKKMLLSKMSLLSDCNHITESIAVDVNKCNVLFNA